MVSEVRIVVNCSAEKFKEYAKRAERYGSRRGGLLLFIQKPGGFAGQKTANKDGIARYFKMCSDYYEKAEPERLAREAELLAQRRAIDEELQKRKRR